MKTFVKYSKLPIDRKKIIVADNIPSHQEDPFVENKLKQAAKKLNQLKDQLPPHKV